MKRKCLLSFLLALIVFTLAAASPATAVADERPVRILAFGYSDNPELFQFCGAIARTLEKKCAMKPEIIIKKTHAEIEFELITGGYDLAILPPQLFLVNLGKVEYSPIAIYSFGENLYRSALFSLKYKNMEEARRDRTEKKVLFVDPFSASGFVVPYAGVREELGKEELEKINFGGFSGSHSASLKALFDREADIIASYSQLLSDNVEASRGVSKIHDFALKIPNDIIVISNQFWNNLSIGAREKLFSAITNIRVGGKRLSKKYNEKHIEEYYAVSRSMEEGCATEEIRIIVPEPVIIDVVRKTRGVTDALRMIENKARLTLPMEKGRKIGVRIINSFDSCMWNLISGESAYVYLGTGFPAEWTGRFPALSGNGSGFYSFKARGAGN